MDDPCTDPIATVRRWLAEADAHGSIRYPNSACLATVDRGRPDARVVLVHTVGERHLLFGGDMRSVKAKQLETCRHAALVFHWEPLERQVRMRGWVEPGDATDADRTFDDRPRESRMTAWASRQSHTVSSRAALEARWRDAAERFAGAETIPRPTTWRGYRFVPEEIELWRAGRYRLHDRTLYARAPGGQWRATVLEP